MRRANLQSVSCASRSEQQKNVGGVSLGSRHIVFMKWTRLVSLLTAWVSLTLNAQTSNEGAGSKSKPLKAERAPLKSKVPSPQEGVPAPSSTVSKVKLTGFTNLGVKRAFFIIIDEAAKSSRSISLTINEELAGLKLIAIDPGSRSVLVVQEGVERVSNV